MGGKRGPGLLYFSFDTDFFLDRKVKALFGHGNFGSDAPILYVYILCEIYRDKGYYLSVDKAFQSVTASDLGISFEKIGLMLNFMLKGSLLFNDTLFNTDKVLTSHGIQIRYQEMVKGRAKKNPVSVNERLWLLSEDETQSFIQVRPDSEFSRNNAPNSRNSYHNSRNTDVNQIKENQRKEKENIKKSAGAPGEIFKNYASGGAERFRGDAQTDEKTADRTCREDTSPDAGGIEKAGIFSCAGSGTKHFPQLARRVPAQGG